MIEFLIDSSLAASAGLNASMPLFLLGLADILIALIVAVVIFFRSRKRKREDKAVSAASPMDDPGAAPPSP